MCSHQIQQSQIIKTHSTFHVNTTFIVSQKGGGEPMHNLSSTQWTVPDTAKTYGLMLSAIAVMSTQQYGNTMPFCATLACNANQNSIQCPAEYIPSTKRNA
jgi:hypothetical protein